ncbi:MAG TPA: methylenetetrahydrofolate reductase [Actinomycetota bacterium]|nr:methylenetetrahydrofolate reductase [Actinomycetota bacterium]
MTLRAESGLERLLHSGEFAVTAEVVPPRGADATLLRKQAEALRGFADAVNVTDNPTSSAHMSSVAGAAVVAAAGLEPVVQIATRDRNRLAITADLLGAWALGARNLLCLSGDPISSGDHPDAADVRDLDVVELVRFAVALRDEGRLLSGRTIESAPRYFVGVADVPLADAYDPGRLEAKLEAGADFVQTQIVYDVEALAGWADGARGRGVFERAFVLVGIAPLRSVRTARYLSDQLGVPVPESVVRRLDVAADPGAEGVAMAVEILHGLRALEGIAGAHIMGLGREELVRRVIEDAGLLPRPRPVSETA